MRRNVVPLLIAALSIVMVVAAFFIYRGTELSRTADMKRIQNAPSRIDERLTIQYDKPPIYQEIYSMRDVNGISTAQYQIHGYSGKLVTITAPPDRNYSVSFFFEQTVQDGIWKLVNKPPRGNTDVHYTLYVHQQVNGEHGSRTIVFTDPHYWAVTAGRQYAIHLDPKKPTPDLLHLQSTSLADPHYQRVIDDFRKFGPPSFRSKVAQAQRMIRSAH
ncbi:MAG TPA: hypothetical protein VIG51_06420 [Candidatus Baltobacteraceae bacterium]|jgi:hypothetical protein